MLAVVEVVEVSWPNPLCPKEDEKGPAVVVADWPNKFPVTADVVTGRPKIVAGVGVGAEGVLEVATGSPRADWVIGALVVNTFWIGLLCPNKVATPVPDVLVAVAGADAWPNRDATTGVAVVTTGAAG